MPLADDIADAAECQAACCARKPATTAERLATRILPAPGKSYDGGCDVWQWCASPAHCGLHLRRAAHGGGGGGGGVARCWIGTSALPCFEPSGNTSGWIAGVRAGTLGYDPRGGGVQRSWESRLLSSALGVCVRETRPDLLPRIAPSRPQQPQQQGKRQQGKQQQGKQQQGKPQQGKFIFKPQARAPRPSGRS